MKPRSSVVYATRVGGKTIDQDWAGGNPFATALIEVGKQEPLSLKALLVKVKAATTAASNGLQVPVWDLVPGHGRWMPANSGAQTTEKRQALVLVVSSYDSTELMPLAGAAVDERRLAAALAFNGFSVTQDVGCGRASILATLRAFAKQTRSADVGLIYCTGHGVHTVGGTLLLPRDYPAQRGFARSTLLKYAVSVDALRDACQGRSINVVLFAGCRTRDDVA